MGSAVVSNAYVKVSWTVTSDARDKIVDGPVPHGLSFINNLEPVAFHFKMDRQSSIPYGPKRYGFLAQDVLALEGSDPVIIDNEDADNLRYAGESLVPVLVNAVKELSAQVNTLMAQNADLEGRLFALENP